MRFCSSVERFRPGIVAERFLVERMVVKPIAELLVGIRHDPLFGPVMLIGTGGTLVEIWRDTATLLLPTDPASIREALLSLRIAPLLNGYRGAPAADIGRIVEAIDRIAEFGHAQRDRLVELDVNPLMILPDRAIAADVLLRIVGAPSAKHPTTKRAGSTTHHDKEKRASENGRNKKRSGHARHVPVACRTLQLRQRRPPWDEICSRACRDATPSR